MWKSVLNTAEINPKAKDSLITNLTIYHDDGRTYNIEKVVWVWELPTPFTIDDIKEYILKDITDLDRVDEVLSTLKPYIGQGL